MPKIKPKKPQTGKSFFVQKKETITESFDFASKGLMKLHLLNEANIEIGSIILSQNETLEKVFEYLQNQLLSNFRLS